jgi:hypothetical protein
MPRRAAASGQELPEKLSEFKPGKTKAKKKFIAGSNARLTKTKRKSAFIKAFYGS